MKEIWKRIDGHPRYEISNMGNLRKSLKTGVINCRGYCLVGIGSGKTHTVHKLVMEAFIGKRPKGMECNHKDGNKTNNSLSNLEWVTPSENLKHAFSHGLKIPQHGETSGLSKLDNVDVISIRTLKEKFNYQQKQLSKMFNVSLANIEAIVQGKTWRHLLGGTP